MPPFEIDDTPKINELRQFKRKNTIHFVVVDIFIFIVVVAITCYCYFSSHFTFYWGEEKKFIIYIPLEIESDYKIKSNRFG